MQQASSLARQAIASSPGETSSEKSSSGEAAAELSRESVELIFRTFSRRFSYRWRPVHEDPKARQLWYSDLLMAGITDRQVRTGIYRTAEHEWPPSTGEFIKACRPSAQDVGAPQPEDAYCEAVRYSGLITKSGFEWSHVVVAAAYHSVGYHCFRWQPEKTSRQRFQREYAIMLRRYCAGQNLDVPTPPALPEEPEYRRPSEEFVKQQINAGRRALGLPVKYPEVDQNG